MKRAFPGTLGGFHERCFKMAEKSNAVSPQDETKLRWFFGGRGHVIETSNCAVQFALAASHNVASFECPVCCGDGMLYCGGIEAKECERCNKTGRIERNVKGISIPRSGYVRCVACHGVVGADPDCGFCHGEGYGAILAAFCHHESEAIAYMDEDAPLFARQGEMLRAMGKIDDQLKAYGERYYGAEGDRWGRTNRGRIFALYDFTNAGRRLLCGSPKAHRNLSGLERIAMLAESDKRMPDRARTDLLASAYLEAHSLLERFDAAWANRNEATSA